MERIYLAPLEGSVLLRMRECFQFPRFGVWRVMGALMVSMD